MSRRFHLLACLCAALACGACSSDPTVDAGGGAGGTDDGATSGTNAGGKSGALPASCPDGTYPGTDTSPVTVGVVSGELVDEQGNPTSAGLVQVCGKDICINARVQEDGRLSERVEQPLDAPACKFGDGLTWGKLAVPLGAGDSELGTLMTVRLPEFADGAPFEPGQAITSSGVTLDLDANVRAEIDSLTYENENEQTFRAALLPEAALAQLQQDFVVGYALAPVDTRLCPPPALTLPNTADLAAGTELELFVLGLDVLEPWAPYGGWQKAGEGRVSDDARALDFPDGLPLLTAIGVRVKG